MNSLLKLISDTSILQSVVQVAARRGWLIEQKKPAHAIAADSWRFDPAATTYATYRDSDGAEVGVAVADVVKKLRLRPAAGKTGRGLKGLSVAGLGVSAETRLQSLAAIGALASTVEEGTDVVVLGAGAVCPVGQPVVVLTEAAWRVQISPQAAGALRTDKSRRQLCRKLISLLKNTDEDHEQGIALARALKNPSLESTLLSDCRIREGTLQLSRAFRSMARPKSQRAFQRAGWRHEQALLNQAFLRLLPDISAEAVVDDSLRMAAISKLAFSSPNHLQNHTQLEAVPAEIGRYSALTTLEIRFNAITTLPPEIGNLTKLTQLDLLSNDITTLPPEIGNLTALESLRLGYNRLRTLPVEITTLCSLRELSLLDNPLSALPDLSELTALERLNLSTTLLPALPESICSLKSLKTLFLQKTRITALPEGLATLPSLELLDLRGCTELSEPHALLRRLKAANPALKVWHSFPPEDTFKPKTKTKTATGSTRKQLTALRKLFKAVDFETVHQGMTLLASNPAPEIVGALVRGCGADTGGIKVGIDAKKGVPNHRIYLAVGFLAASGQLDAVTSLRLQESGQGYTFPTVPQLPPGIERAKKLSVADFSRLQLTTLPEGLRDNTTLRRLNLSYNAMTTLDVLWTLRGLNVLHLNNMDLSGLALSGLGQLSALETLDLSKSHTAILPAEIGNLTKLHKLNLDNNTLTTLPDSVGSLSRLRELYLSDNTLTTLPESIGALKLTKLTMTSCRLKTLPAALLRQSQLTSLEVGNNALTNLNGIGAMSGLTVINVAQNQLRSLPAEIGTLHEVTQLSADKNSISKLPAEIGTMKKLWSLYLRDNKVKALPAEIGQLSQLVHLSLARNAITTLPPEIGQLAKLETLDLIDNQLTALPPELARLKNLKTLKLGPRQRKLVKDGKKLLPWAEVHYRKW